MEYMKTVEREQMIREQGEKIGEKRGEKRGDILRTVKILRNMRKTMKADEAALVSGLEQEYVERIFFLLETYLKERDEEIAERMLSEQYSGNK